MSDDGPREYDREFRRPLSGPTQARVAFDRDKNRITRFVVQLEYYHDGEWNPVVRYDHDSIDNEQSHDVAEEGLHIDIYRDNEKHATEYVSPPLPPAIALDRAEDHLANNLQRFVTRYETWHRITNR
ncbi:MAG: DUF7718 family protein [Halohasta sp.]